MKQTGLVLALSLVLGLTLVPEAAWAWGRNVVRGDIRVGVKPRGEKSFRGHEHQLFRPHPFFRHKFKIHHRFKGPGHFRDPRFPRHFGHRGFVRPKFRSPFVPAIPPTRPVWVPGSWGWTGFGWVWIPGHWVR